MLPWVARGGMRRLSPWTRVFSSATVTASFITAAPSPKRPPIGDHGFDADLLVIGGGSGGLACAREAARYGASVVVLDAVSPSPQGTTWGLGGTCVNVGCIPKKLMHQAGLLGTALHDAKEYGWELEPKSIKHNWEKLRDSVQDYISGTNFGYRTALRQEGIEYINGFGRFADPHTIICTDKKGKERKLTAESVVIAVGGRPSSLNIPNADELCVSSDDLFSLSHPPGKTLVIGAGYVALECAGLLTSLGHPSTVMMRSIPLRGFDTQMANLAVDYMVRHGTRFLRNSVPVRIELSDVDSSVKEGKQVKVTWSDGKTESSDSFDTVLLATGRTPSTKRLNLDGIGVKVNGSGKIIAAGSSGALTESTTVSNVYAVGDVLEGRPELTPVAIQAGRLLAKRLYANHLPPDTLIMDYDNVPTAVFTPLEYGCVGLSEEAAISRYGADRVEVYHLGYDTLGMAVAHRTSHDGKAEQAACYAKAVVVLPEGMSASKPAGVDRQLVETVVGLHLLGPSAGEVIQGFSVALRAAQPFGGLTVAALTSSIGIHPTQAEEFVLLDRTKRSGVKAVKTSC